MELILAAVWSFLMLLTFIYLSAIKKRPMRIDKYAYLWIVIAVLVARLVPNFLTPSGDNYDIASYTIVGDLVINHEDVYNSESAVNRHPYLPFQMYWLGLSREISQVVHLQFVQVVRLAPILADLGIALLIFFELGRQISIEMGFYSALLYAFNPISIFVSAYHGQFDAVPVLLIILAFLCVEKTAWLSGGWLGLAILDKSWPVLALPSLVNTRKKWRDRIFILIFVIGIPLIGVFIYSNLFHADPFVVIEKAIVYNRGIGIWGYTFVLKMCSLFSPLFRLIYRWLLIYGRFLTLILLGIVWLFFSQKEKPIAGFLTVIVTFFAITHAFAIQYLVWPVAFAILDQDHRWLVRYTITAYIYMVIAYFTLIISYNIIRIMPMPQADWAIIIPLGLPAWIVTIFWMVNRLKNPRKNVQVYG